MSSAALSLLKKRDPGGSNRKTGSCLPQRSMGAVLAGLMPRRADHTMEKIRADA